ncbi:hypothetical protein [Amorphus orientalis]|uniref:Uncharacterized protein n=1 Tax=Amorphus orientalis TaxID=649198 RepID=A0AAE4ASP7_9HYPH|nr:hypothetical protein [Amorphus orientalis]MDQ0315478.1 hypothetical protein [Amorphus orientalis]
MQHGPLSLSQRNLQEQEAFRRIYLLTFPLFLLAALIARLASVWPGHLLVRTGDRKTIFGEAKALANSTIPFAFIR